MSVLTVMLKTHHQKKDGTYPVVIRVQAGRTTYEYIGHSVMPDQFREQHGKWIYKHPDAALINNAIEAKRLAILERMEIGRAHV